MASKKADRDLIERAKRYVKYSGEYHRENRDNARKVLRFIQVPGAQWDDDIRAMRERQHLPVLEANTLPTFIAQVVADCKQSMPAIKVGPVGDGADKERAEILEGWVRHVEQASMADAAKLEAFRFAVTAGWPGYLRILSEYSSDEGAGAFTQDLLIRAVKNPFTVFVDPHTVKPDYSDMRYAVIVEDIPDDVFKELYPKAADSIDFDAGDASDINEHWRGDKQVRIAEVFYLTHKEVTLVSLADGRVMEEGELEKARAEYVAEQQEAAISTPEEGQAVQPQGNPETPDAPAQVSPAPGQIAPGGPAAPIPAPPSGMGAQAAPYSLFDEPDPFELDRFPDGRPKTRKVQRPCVKWYKCTGATILEEEREWPGRAIPIIPVEPKSMVVEGKIKYEAMCQWSLDSQRVKNYYKTKIAEGIASSPKAPYIGTPKMFATFEDMWANANIDNAAYLLFNMDPQAPGMRPERTPPPQVQSAVIEAERQSMDDIKATIGLHNASLGAEGNETSGVAINARAQQGDASTAMFAANLANAVQICGQQAVDLFPHYYDTERTIRTLGIDGAEKNVQINQKIGELVINDLTVGKYKVTVTVGPSFASERAESQAALMNFMKVLAPPQAMAIAGHVAKEQDWMHSDEISEILNRMVPPGILPNGQGQPQQPQGPPPQLMIEQMKAQAEQSKTQATIQTTQVKAQAEVQKANLAVQQAQIETEGKVADHHIKMAENERRMMELMQPVQPDMSGYPGGQ